MAFQRSLLLTVGAFGLLAACSSAEEPKPDPVEATLQGRFEGQAVAILPLDPTNSACAKDPQEMDPATLGACTHLDLTKLPEPLKITKDPRRFDPRQTSAMLVIQGTPLDPAHPNVTWRAVLGLGPAVPATETSLVKSVGSGAGHVEPLAAVVLLAPAVPALIEGATWLVGAAAVLFGAKAVVDTRNILNRQPDEVVNETAQNTSASVKLLMSEGEQLKKAIQDATSASEKHGDPNCRPDGPTLGKGRKYARHCFSCGDNTGLEEKDKCVGVDPRERRSKPCTCRRVPKDIGSHIDDPYTTKYWDCIGGPDSDPDLIYSVFSKKTCDNFFDAVEEVR